MMKETTWLEKYVPKIFFGGIAVLFTVMGFIVHPNGTEILWDKLHPFSVADAIGCLGFYAGCVVISGLLKPIYNPEHSVASNILWFVGMLISVALIWNL